MSVPVQKTMTVLRWIPLIYCRFMFSSCGQCPYKNRASFNSHMRHDTDLQCGFLEKEFHQIITTHLVIGNIVSISLINIAKLFSFSGKLFLRDPFKLKSPERARKEFKN